MILGNQRRNRFEWGGEENQGFCLSQQQLRCPFNRQVDIYVLQDVGHLSLEFRLLFNGTDLTTLCRYGKERGLGYTEVEEPAKETEKEQPVIRGNDSQKPVLNVYLDLD